MPAAAASLPAKSPMPENHWGTYGASVSSSSLSAGIDDTSLSTLAPERAMILGFRDR